MRKFLIEYSFALTCIGDTSVSSEVVTACSKYDAKRRFKRAHPAVTIIKVTPYEE